jgi:hypothetical protein
MKTKIDCSNLLAKQSDRSLKPKKAMQGDRSLKPKKAMQAKAMQAVTAETAMQAETAKTAMQADTAQTAMKAKTAMQAIMPTSCLAIYTSKQLQNEDKNRLLQPLGHARRYVIKA